MQKLIFIILSVSAVNLSWSQSIYDDFDDYKAGEYLGIESNGLWTTWTNSPGGTEDTFVSDEYSYSADNSIKLMSGGVTDVVLPLGDLTSGNWTLSFMMRIEPGYGAYFNLLHEFAAAASNWAVQVYFSETGNGYLSVGSGLLSSNFTHPTGSWFEVKVDIDIDSDLAGLYFDDTLISNWTWSEGSVNMSSTIAALNLYPNGQDGEPDSYYVDNVSFSEYGVGLSELEKEITIYPNPVVNYFSVKNVKNTELRVFNLLGLEVLKMQTAAIDYIVDCSDWTPGIYFLQIKNDHEVLQTKKIIVE